MRIISVIFVFIILTNFGLALEADFDCPESVSAGEEFNCFLTASDFSGEYDVKVDISPEGKTIAKIFDPNSDSWKSSYYYLYNFISDSEGQGKEIKLKIEGDYEGKTTGILKLRQGSKTEKFDFDLIINKGSAEGAEDDGEGAGVGEGGDESEEPPEEVLSQLDLEKRESARADFIGETLEPYKNETIINLNPQQEINKVIYKSKDQKIQDYAIYGFALFLIFLIIVILIRGN